MKKRSGFTVIELMVVISIITILTAISIPNMIRWRSDHQLNSAARVVFSAIQQMRMEAVKNNTQTWIFFDAANKLYRTYIYLRSGGGQWQVNSYNLPSELTIAPNFGAMGPWLSYNDRGMPLTAGNMTFTNKNGVARTITVALTGYPKIT